jgi:FixJ family two-component response regulator
MGIRATGLAPATAAALPRQDGNGIMRAKTRICIIDANDRRRNTLEAKLERAFAIVAMRQPGDLVAAWPDTDAAFVADEYGNLMHVRHIAVQKQEVLPIVAFGEGFDADQAISAIYAGAIDCIDLNRHRRDLADRLELALRRRSHEFDTRLKAMRSASELADLDRGKRRILGLFASGKGHERISRELGISEAQLNGEIAEITQQLRLPALKDAVRMMIDYFR